jgi:hypothetical protein
MKSMVIFTWCLTSARLILNRFFASLERKNLLGEKKTAYNCSGCSKGRMSSSLFLSISLKLKIPLSKSWLLAQLLYKWAYREYSPRAPVSFRKLSEWSSRQRLAWLRKLSERMVVKTLWLLTFELMYLNLRGKRNFLIIFPFAPALFPSAHSARISSLSETMSLQR